MSIVRRNHHRRRPARIASLWGVAASALFLGGCDDGPPRFALSGQVSYDGVPVEAGNIGFVPMPADATTAAGAEIANGRYEIPRHEGPVAGTYRVVIYAERPAGEKIAAEEGGGALEVLEQYIPPQYNEASNLEVEIGGDQAELNFALEKPARSRRRR